MLWELHLILHKISFLKERFTVHLDRPVSAGVELPGGQVVERLSARKRFMEVNDYWSVWTVKTSTETCQNCFMAMTPTVVVAWFFIIIYFCPRNLSPICALSLPQKYTFTFWVYSGMTQYHSTLLFWWSEVTVVMSPPALFTAWCQ